VSHNSKRQNQKPTILVTGASGFIGKHFLNAIKDDFYIYAIARRSQKESGIPVHPNIIWGLGDISDENSVKRITDKIAAKGGVDYIFHFAGYYDYENKDKPEYYKTNVNGTRYLLENAEKLNILRFFYSSSLTVTEFTDPNIVINESSPANSDSPYPRSKAMGEELVRQFSSKFPCTIVRVAAIFSDWCEFGPLYMLISTWLSSGWNSKILGGKGQTAIPYMHIIDLINFFLHLLYNQEKLSDCDTILASSESSITHIELFELATKYNYGQSLMPFFMPKYLSYIGIHILNTFGFLLGKKTFERPWMAKFIDKQMNVDITKTKEILNWEPIPRYDLKRRLLYLIENMRYNPFNWTKINKAILSKENKERPNVKIFEALIKLKDQTINENIEYVLAPENAKRFNRYQMLPKEELIDRIRYLYHMFEIAIHYGDRQHIIAFIPNLARARYLEGFEFEEIASLVDYLGQHIINNLLSLPHMKGIKKRIESEITITVQIIKDQVEDVFDRLKANHPCKECREAGIWLCTHEAALTVINNKSLTN
jgi:nucleoside-diphosphate-sugar epimerase